MSSAGGEGSAPLNHAFASSIALLSGAQWYDFLGLVHICQFVISVCLSGRYNVKGVVILQLLCSCPGDFFYPLKHYRHP